MEALVRIDTAQNKFAVLLNRSACCVLCVEFYNHSISFHFSVYHGLFGEMYGWLMFISVQLPLMALVRNVGLNIVK